MKKIKDTSWLDSCPISLMFLNRLLVSLNFIQFLSQSYESEMAFILNFKPRQNGVIINPSITGLQFNFIQDHNIVSFKWRLIIWQTWAIFHIQTKTNGTSTWVKTVTVTQEAFNGQSLEKSLHSL